MNSLNLNKDIFDTKNQLTNDSRVVFVADLFIEDYVGGAELTSEALISESPLKIDKIKAKDVTIEMLKQGSQKYWIFGNFSSLNPQLIPTIVANLQYSILEYDYKYCRYRSPEKHESITASSCDCHKQVSGKIVSAFFYGANSLWWMSEAQKNWYHKLFPFLTEKTNIVLSSVFSKDTLGKIKLLRNSNLERKSWVVLGSDSWVKGFEDAKLWCQKNALEYDVLWNVPYETTLAKLSTSEGFVYLPKGKDTCPRMVIEAKLLNCKLTLNDNVQHANESWFDTNDIESIEEYLYAAPTLFWNSIKNSINYNPKISGYTTTHNCVKQNYPFIEAIQSMLQFCDEVCVVDGGSSDGTWEKLQNLSTNDSRLVLKQIERDWNHPRFALFDGEQKAEARKLCTGEFLWQMDSDEVVHENDANKIKDLVKKFPKGVDLIALPVIEYWGSTEKIRIDVNPWKWRLSRNNPNITHGIPKHHRKFDEEGRLCSLGSDGCDYIYADSFEPVQFISFYTNDVDAARRAAVSGNVNALNAYQNWLTSATTNLPGVHHYSWYDIKRKIYTYKNYWSKHWTSLFNQSQEDTPENNKFFGKKWADVTDEEIEQLALKLKTEMGGWIFHSQVDFTKPTSWIKLSTAQPSIMSSWTAAIEGKNE